MSVTIITNIIISQNIINVNNPVENFAEKVQVVPETSKKWIGKKTAAEKMALKMEEAGFEERAYRMATCAEVIKYKYCQSCGRYEVERASLCRDRYCPVCMWRLATQRALAMREIITAAMERRPDVEYYFLTLTVPNCKPDRLKKHLDEMQRGWNRMVSRKIWKESVIGFARALEITYNKETREFHPHYHIIICLHNKRQLGTESDLINLWIETNRMNASYLAQSIKPILAAKSEEQDRYIRAVLETFKYTTKTSDLDKMPLDNFRTFVTQTAGRRVTSFGGLLKEIKAEINAETEEIKDEELKVCKSCGADVLIDAIARWSYTDHQYKIVKDASLN